MPGYVQGFVRDLGLLGLELPQGDYKHPIFIIRRWSARRALPANAMMDMLRASQREG